MHQRPTPLLGASRRSAGVVGAQVVRQDTDAFAAVSPHDGTLDSLILPQANGQTMSLFVREVAQRHPEEFVLMALVGPAGIAPPVWSSPHNCA